MDVSTRLYARLGEIAEDPNNPESLAELLVCAFGAFERYYICWKTQSGQYRQDGHDLPPALNNWLYPSDGSTRDFATLQVVFGRGEEYFASDKDGKLEFKEPELPKPAEGEGKFEKSPIRRARTVSFLRPLSEISNRSDSSAATSGTESNRSSTTSSRRLSRTPSFSYSRTNSDASLPLQEIDEPLSGGIPPKPAKPSIIPQWTPLGTSTRDFDPSSTLTKLDTRQTSSSTSSKSPQKPQPSFIPPEGYMLVPINSTSTYTQTSTQTSTQTTQPPPPPKPKYTSTSTQTSPTLTPLRIDTTTSDNTTPWSSTDSSIHTPLSYYPDSQVLVPVADNPISMGRMLGYFSKPTYQLGDSLASGYGHPYGFVGCGGGGGSVSAGCGEMDMDMWSRVR